MASETPLSDVRFLTVAEVALIMRVSKMTVYRLVHSGELEAIRVGRSFRGPGSGGQSVSESRLRRYRLSRPPGRASQAGSPFRGVRLACRVCGRRDCRGAWPPVGVGSRDPRPPGLRRMAGIGRPSTPFRGNL